MGNVRTTPILQGDPAAGGLTPGDMARAIADGTLPGATGTAERYIDSPATDSVAIEYGEGIKATGVRVNAKHDAYGRWAEVRVAILPSAQQGSVERVNRLISELQDGHAGAPRIETYWRTRSLTVKVPGHPGRAHTPAVIVGSRSAATGGFVWRIDSAASVATPTAAPVKAAPVKVRAPRRTAAKVTAPTAVDVSLPGMGEGTGAHPSSPAPEAPAPKVAVPVASAPALTPAPDLFRSPESLAPGFKVYHDPVLEGDLTVAAAKHAAGERTVVMIQGPTGVGKSLTARVVASRWKLPFLQIDAAGMNTFEAWAGAVALDESPTGIVTRYAPSLLVEAVRADGRYGGIPRMVLIDEASRVTSSGALNPLLTMTDGNGFLYVPDAHVSIPIDPAVLWVLTANIGSQYSGTATIDAAMRNRMTDNLEVGYPAPKDEARMLTEQGGCSLPVAEAFVKVAAQVRAMSANGTIADPGVSTRQLIAAAQSVARGATPLRGAITGFVNAYSAEGGTASERSKVLVAAQAALQGLTS